MTHAHINPYNTHISTHISIHSFIHSFIRPVHLSIHPLCVCVHSPYREEGVPEVLHRGCLRGERPHRGQVGGEGLEEGEESTREGVPGTLLDEREELAHSEPTRIPRTHQHIQQRPTRTAGELVENGLA